VLLALDLSGKTKPFIKKIIIKKKPQEPNSAIMNMSHEY
jgi:hypothetical protein